MTETSLGAGGGELSGLPGMTDTEAARIDHLIDLLLALEPFEVKQTAAGSHPVAVADTMDDDAGEGARADEEALTEQETAGADIAAETGEVCEAAKPFADSTSAMLRRMRAVLDREAARLGEDGLEGKAAVDQVALIARTLEKIDQMERLIAEDQARARSQTLSGEEREQMRQTVRQLILSAAERMVAERTHDPRHADEQPNARSHQDASSQQDADKAEQAPQ